MIISQKRSKDSASMWNILSESVIQMKYLCLSSFADFLVKQMSNHHGQQIQSFCYFMAGSLS